MELSGLFFYLVSVLIAGGIYAVLCLALNVQWGMGGLFNWVKFFHPGSNVMIFSLKAQAELLFPVVAMAVLLWAGVT